MASALARRKVDRRAHNRLADLRTTLGSRTGLATYKGTKVMNKQASISEQIVEHVMTKLAAADDTRGEKKKMGPVKGAILGGLAGTVASGVAHHKTNMRIGNSIGKHVVNDVAEGLANGVAGKNTAKFQRRLGNTAGMKRMKIVGNGLALGGAALGLAKGLANKAAAKKEAGNS